MKTLTLILLALCLAIGGGHAQAPAPAKNKTLRPTSITKEQADAHTATLGVQAHVLQIFSEHGDKFFLVLDGEKINSEPKAKVVAENLTKGFYRAKIIFDDERLPDFNANIQLEGVDPGWNEVTHRIKKKVKKGKTTYSLGYGDWKKIGEAPPTRNQQALEEMNRERKQETHNPPPVIPPGKQEAVHNETVIAPVVNACGAVLPDAAFQTFLTTIENTSFEDSKVQTGLVVIDGNCLTALQIKQLIQKFGFEQSRLNFAQTAYHRCLDPQNYLVVNDAFQFNSSKDVMNTYVLEQKNKK